MTRIMPLQYSVQVSYVFRLLHVKTNLLLHYHLTSEKSLLMLWGIVFAIFSTCFNIKNTVFCPHSVFTYFA